MLNKKIKKIHCIGIGGIGVSGIAALLHKKGYQVTGSDLKASSLTAQLEKSGIKIFYHHSPENIDDADLIVYKCKYSSDASGNDGKWYFTEYSSDAQKKIFFTEYSSDADLKIYSIP